MAFATAVSLLVLLPYAQVSYTGEYATVVVAMVLDMVSPSRCRRPVRWRSMVKGNQPPRIAHISWTGFSTPRDERTDS
jgi:hypothetical protein